MAMEMAYPPEPEHTHLPSKIGMTAHDARMEAETNDVQDLILSCNKDGMESLRKATSNRNDPHLKAAFEQFKYAEAVLLANQTENDNMTLLAVTCNNLGCYYKKVGKYHGALSYLRRALKMEIELETDEVTVASTHLNLCAILSKLEKHDKAVQHALSALELMSRVVTASGETGASSDDYAVLAIAYHNVAMEREFLQQWDQAASAYQTGYQVAKRLLGENHPLSITLGKNCEAVLNKAARTAKVSKGRGTTVMVQEPEGGASGGSNFLGGGLSLPPLGGLGAQGADPLKPAGEKRTVRNEAADWVKSEEALWVNFAQKALQTGDASGPLLTARTRDLAEAEEANHTPQKLQPITTLALKEMQGFDTLPQAHDMGAFRIQTELPDRSRQLLKQTPLGQALDSHPEALIDIVDAEAAGNVSMRAAHNDFRPNRSIKRSTRTSRVVRRTGVYNSTHHRDRVEADLEKKRANPASKQQSVQAQRLAAERIQKVWRSWYAYCQENSEWMTITWICATMIQAHWRSYHVRRQQLDRHASTVQRHIRGFLVRSVMKRHSAAVTIQRHVVGMLTRKKLNNFHTQATNIQRLVRGGLARRRFRTIRRDKLTVVITIQRHIRAWIAKRIVDQKREERYYRETLHKATVDLQRQFRGWKGRQIASERRIEYLQVKREDDAANLLQSMVRGRQARRKVGGLRDKHTAEMEKAATFLRKVWIGAKTRRQFLQLQQEFKANEDKITTIQRYLRGCMCRLKMWREALRTEEELWACIEIQRMYRGYRGRVRWEDEYEVMWQRELSAAALQRQVRGWLARLRVNRQKRKIARAEFEHARDRFRAAQKIQGLVRAVLARKRIQARLARARHAAAQIQRIARGRALRRRLWEQVIIQRVVMVQAGARGYLVRRRKFHLLAKVILIQRAYRRRLQRLSLEARAAQGEKMARRKNGATVIQRRARQHAEHKRLQRIGLSAGR